MKTNYKIGFVIIVVCLIFLISNNYNVGVEEKTIEQKTESGTVWLNTDDLDIYWSIKINDSEPDYKIVLRIDDSEMDVHTFREFANQSIDAIMSYNYTFIKPMPMDWEATFGDLYI